MSDSYRGQVSDETKPQAILAIWQDNMRTGNGWAWLLMDGPDDDWHILDRGWHPTETTNKSIASELRSALAPVGIREVQCYAPTGKAHSRLWTVR